MKVELKKFGTRLVSRPDGREAFLVFKAYLKPKTKDESIELDFSEIHVLTPSWLDEFLRGIKETFPSNRIKYLSTENASVIESIKIIEEE